jgi:3-dehydroquinate dehydratase-1
MRPCVKPPLLIRDVEFGGPKPVFCIPLVATGLTELLKQAKVARDLRSDLVEWRADSYQDLSVTGLLEASHALRSVMDHQPVLFTLRISSEGGAQTISQDTRIRCIDAVARSGSVDLVDIELSNGPQVLESVIQAAHGCAVRVIVSFHDFQATPSHETLFTTISAMVAAGADIAKIACMPREPSDVLRVLQVTLSARQTFPGVSLCTISMGALGLLSRVAGFLYGSDMAFAAGAASSAPGQIALDEARSVTEVLLRSI